MAEFYSDTVTDKMTRMTKEREDMKPTRSSLHERRQHLEKGKQEAHWCEQQKKKKPHKESQDLGSKAPLCTKGDKPF